MHFVFKKGKLVLDKNHACKDSIYVSPDKQLFISRHIFWTPGIRCKLKSSPLTVYLIEWNALWPPSCIWHCHFKDCFLSYASFVALGIKVWSGCIGKYPFQDSSWQWKESVWRYEFPGLGRIHLEIIPGNRISFSIVPDNLKGPFRECQQLEEYIRRHSSR